MPNKKRKLNINLSNRWLYFFITLGILAIVSVGVYAATYTASGGGHPITEISTCPANQIIKMNSAGNTWTCADDATGSVDLQGWSFGNDVLYDDGANVIQTSDSWLRLNQAGSFSSGTYTPGVFRADGGLCIGTDCRTSWPGGGTSQWTTSGSNIYYNDGNVGIGTTNPQSKLSVGGSGNSGYGIYGEGSGAGVYGLQFPSGSYGMLGTSNYGVYGSGYTTGVYGTGTYYGVLGYGATYGVVGEDTDSGSYGRLGYGNYGVYGNGQAYGVYGYSSNIGVRGSGSEMGVYGQSSHYGVYGNGGTYDFYSPHNSYGYGSSIRWKENVERIPDALDKVMNLKGVYFNWDEEHGGKYDMGFIAEEVGEVIPEAVIYEDSSNSLNWYNDNGETKLYASGIRSNILTPVLVEAIKELKTENDELKEELCSKDDSYSWC